MARASTIFSNSPAIGKIAAYQAVMGATFLCILPAGWVGFKLGGAPVSVFWIALGFYVAAMCFRVWFTHRLAGMAISRWVREVLFRALAALLPGVAVAGVVCWLARPGLPRFILLLLTSSPTVALGILVFGMDAAERKRWFGLGKTFLAKISAKMRPGAGVGTAKTGLETPVNPS